MTCFWPAAYSCVSRQTIPPALALHFRRQVARRYVIERSTDLGLTNPWHPSPQDPQSFGADYGSATTRTTLDVAAPTRFFRIKAELPLQQP